MKRTFLCILCPNGCEIEAEASGGQLIRCSGNRCRKGRDYASQELLRPMRMVTTTVEVSGGNLPLCPVRLTAPIPRERIFDAVREIHRCSLCAPVEAGQVLIRDLLQLGVDVISTRAIPTGTPVEL